MNKELLDGGVCRHGYSIRCLRCESPPIETINMTYPTYRFKMLLAFEKGYRAARENMAKHYFNATADQDRHNSEVNFLSQLDEENKS